MALHEMTIDLIDEELTGLQKLKVACGDASAAISSTKVFNYQTASNLRREFESATEWACRRIKVLLDEKDRRDHVR